MFFIVCSTDKSNENNEKKTNNGRKKNSINKPELLRFAVLIRRAPINKTNDF